MCSSDLDGRAYSDRVEAAPALAAVIDRGVDESFAGGQATDSCPSMPIAADRRLSRFRGDGAAGDQRHNPSGLALP